MGDTQWEELDGDGSLLKVKGQAYVDIADAIVRSMGALDNITDQIDNKSLAMDKTRKVATDVRDSIKNAEGRYRETGAALVDYGTALAAAKGEADPAAEVLRTLRDEYDTAQASAGAAEDAVEDLPDNASDADKSDAERQATSAGSEASRIAGEIAKYERQWQGGKNDKDTGARDAASRIDEQFERDEAADFTDGFWDHVGDWAGKLYKVFKVICDIAGILAIFLSWVPILGQVLVALAAIGAILSILESVVKFAKGDIGFGAMLVGVGLGVLSLFGGKLATQLSKFSKMKTLFSSSNRMNSIVLAGGDDGVKLLDDAMVFRNGLPIGGSPIDKLKYAFKTPFTQSTSQIAVREAFENGSMTAGEAFKATVKNSFPNPFASGALKGNVLGETSTLTAKLADMGVDGVRLEGPWRSAQVLSAATFGSTLTSNTVGAINGFTGGDIAGGIKSSIGVPGTAAGGSWGGAVSSPITIMNDVKLLGTL
jgi:predicted  nucleic acid-binding Zn-ribbon protein